MEQDLGERTDFLDAYDDDGRALGVQNRGVVHSTGVLHYAIHCWVIGELDGKQVVVFQKRKKNKRLFPGKYDVAAAGHYIHSEYGSAGLRELEEELGRQTSNYRIVFYKVMKINYRNRSVKNNELCNICLCKYLHDVKSLCFNREEIEDVVALELDSARRVVSRECVSVEAYSLRDKGYIQIKTNEFIDEYREYFVETIDFIKSENNMISSGAEKRYYTFVMLKPDAIKRNLVSEIVSFWMEKGFRIELFSIERATEEKINAHYAEKIAEEGDIYIKKARVYFHNSYVVPIILSHESSDIISNVRKWVGYKDPQFAEKDTIRGRWGIDSMDVSEREVRCCENLIHASDSTEAFHREAMLWLKRNEVEKFLF